MLLLMQRFIILNINQQIYQHIVSMNLKDLRFQDFCIRTKKLTIIEKQIAAIDQKQIIYTSINEHFMGN